MVVKPETQNHIPAVSPQYAERLAMRRASPHQQVWTLLDQVFDPELPGLTIWDLGVLQKIERQGERWHIGITLTYSGCPAVDAIKQDIVQAMTLAGHSDVDVDVLYTPIWSTEMMSPQGKQHLKSIHIAPPNPQNNVPCPVCDSASTQLISQFGSTACKALYQCQSCHESFDYFKHF